jgi:hypothetical protein
MKDVTSAETAQALKAAGFPQPIQSAGQLWYFQRYPQGSARHWAIVILTNGGIEPLDGGNLEGDLQNMVYAPVGIEAMPYGYMIYESGDKFHCTIFGGLLFSHENPAEACAAAWLAFKR